MSFKVFLANISNVEGGVENTVLALLERGFKQSGVEMGALVTPAACNLQFIEQCRLYAQPCLELPELSTLFFGQESVSNTGHDLPAEAEKTHSSPTTKSLLVQMAKRLLPAQWDLHYWQRTLYLRSKPIFRSAFCDYHPDIIHARAGMYSWIAPIVKTLKTESGPTFILHIGNAPVLGDLSGWTLRQWLKMDMMIFVSAQLKEIWHDRYPSLQKIPHRVVYNGADLNRFPYVDRSKRANGCDVPVRIGMCGRLSSAKGTEDGIRAFASIAASAPALHLDIVGDGPERARLNQLVHDLGCADRVTFHGHQDNVAPFLEKFDILLHPSRAEAFGISIAEAMATGLPVAATRVGGIPEVVQHGTTGLLAPSGDIDALAHNLMFLVNNPDQRLGFGRAGHQRAAQYFSIDQVCSQIFSTYSELLNPAH